MQSGFEPLAGATTVNAHLIRGNGRSDDAARHPDLFAIRLSDGGTDLLCIAVGSVFVGHTLALFRVPCRRLAALGGKCFPERAEVGTPAGNRP